MNTRRGSGARGNAGFSLLEVLIAVALLGIAVAGTLPLISAGIFGSGLQDRFASARRWIVNAGDYATSPNLPRIPCTSTNTDTIISTYQAALRDTSRVARPGFFTATDLTVTGVLFWNGTSFTTTCVEPSQPALTMQQISLRVITTDGRVTETLDVVRDG